jgi:hypothetical protein
MDESSSVGSTTGNGFNRDPSGALSAYAEFGRGWVLVDGEGVAVFSRFSALAAFFNELFEGFGAGGLGAGREIVSEERGTDTRGVRGFEFVVGG